MKEIILKFSDEIKHKVVINTIKLACNVNTGSEEVIIEYTNVDDNTNGYVSIINVYGNWYINNSFNDYRDYAFSFEKSNYIIEELDNELEILDINKIDKNNGYTNLLVDRLINVVKEKNSLWLNNEDVVKLFDLLEVEIDSFYKDNNDYELMYLLESYMYNNISSNLDNVDNLIIFLRRILVMYNNCSNKNTINERKKRILDIIRRLRVIEHYSGKHLDYLIYSLNNTSIVSIDSELELKFIDELTKFIDVYYDDIIENKSRGLGFETKLLMIIYNYKNLYIDKYKDIRIEDIDNKNKKKIVEDTIGDISNDVTDNEEIIEIDDNNNDEKDSNIDRNDKDLVEDTIGDISNDVTGVEKLVYFKDFNRDEFSSKVINTNKDINEIFVVVNINYFNNFDSNRYVDRFRTFIVSNNSFMKNEKMVRFYQTMIDYSSSKYSMIEKYLEYVRVKKEEKIEPLFFSDKDGKMIICYFSVCDSVDKYDDILPSYEIDVELNDDVHLDKNDFFEVSFDNGVSGRNILYTNDKIYGISKLDNNKRTR